MLVEHLGLRKGQQLRVTVIEVLSEGGVLVESRGQLFRVTNESKMSLQKNQTVTLTVISENPLQFRIESRTRMNFDRFA
jgi:hypothetical protein